MNKQANKSVNKKISGVVKRVAHKFADIAAGRAVKKAVAPLLTVCLTFVSVFSSTGETVLAAENYDSEYLYNVTVHVDGNDFNAKTVNYYYDNNIYISLRDMAAALAGTEAKFNVVIDSSAVSIYTGSDYTLLGCEGSEFKKTTLGYGDTEFVQRKNASSVNGYTGQYYTFIYPIEDYGYDCYMLLTDLALILDTDMEFDENGELYVSPAGNLEIDPRALEDEEFFSGINAALVGDATTGEIYYSYEGDAQVAIASTTKLMTYAVVMDAIDKGEISLTDRVVTSQNVAKLTNSVDCSGFMGAGVSITIEDLLYGMLLPSSNECALTLAEAVSGSQEAFAVRMNKFAEKIGMSEDSKFYTASGLPIFVNSVFDTKTQNHITADDMFKLVCYIFAKYPQITDITSCTYKYLPSIGKTVYNTNSCLYNVRNCVGLKTGMTNRAGYCLVSAIQLGGDDGNHMIVSIVYGAPDAVTRNFISKTMLTYGRRVFANGGVSSIEDYQSPVEEDDYYEGMVTAYKDTIPDNPEELAQLIVWTARNYLPEPVPDTNIDY